MRYYNRFGFFELRTLSWARSVGFSFSGNGWCSDVYMSFIYCMDKIESKCGEMHFQQRWNAAEDLIKIRKIHKAKPKQPHIISKGGFHFVRWTIFEAFLQQKIWTTKPYDGKQRLKRRCKIKYKQMKREEWRMLNVLCWSMQ